MGRDIAGIRRQYPSPSYNVHTTIFKLDVTAKSYKYALACINIPLSYIKSDRRMCRERPPCRSESGFASALYIYATLCNKKGFLQYNQALFFR